MGRSRSRGTDGVPNRILGELSIPGEARDREDIILLGRTQPGGDLSGMQKGRGPPRPTPARVAAFYKLFN